MAETQLEPGVDGIWRVKVTPRGAAAVSGSKLRSNRCSRSCANYGTTRTFSTAVAGVTRAVSRGRLTHLDQGRVLLGLQMPCQGESEQMSHGKELRKRVLTSLKADYSHSNFAR